MPEEMEYQDPVETTEPAAEPEESATSEQEADTTTAPETTTEPVKKDGVQERIDSLTFKRREAERERDYWREQAMRQAQPEAPTQPKPIVEYPDLPEPKSDSFDTYDAFVDARAEWRAEVKLRQYVESQKTQSQNKTVDAWKDQARSKHQDFDDVFTKDVPVTEMMGQVLLQSKQGHDLAYYLGKNPSEAHRIYNLPPGLQAYEMGKLETKLAAPPQRTNTNAPNPTSPVGGREMPSKKPEDMTYEEYKAYMEARGL